MKKQTMMLMALVPAMMTCCRVAASTLPEPGPMAGGLRLRLIVTPHPEDGKEGYDVQVDLLSVSRDATVLRVGRWPGVGAESGFQQCLEAQVSIESYPAIEPWHGQVMVPPKDAAAEPEYVLKPGEMLSLHWHATGRHLKNCVANPLAVQNPEFVEPGLYSVHASLVLMAGGHLVGLRSDEQLVPIGGSLGAPKHTYGQLLFTDENTRTARFGLGSLQKIAPGDRFLVQSGLIGMTWTLTVTNVLPTFAMGTLEPSQVDPTPAFPSRGANAALILRK